MVTLFCESCGLRSEPGDAWVRRSGFGEDVIESMLWGDAAACPRCGSDEVSIEGGLE